ncbi:MAG: hypothetical protein VKK98_00570 [Cyanobacteriota bacterium]|nr:hypothetical protein [Cyanobacteriota bacterium]
MADSSSRSDRSPVLLSAMAGAVLGAAGLAWWLLAETERRRRHGGVGQNARQAAAPDAPPVDPTPDPDLHDKVHQLNQAIEDVRRQLESLAAGG